MSDPIYVPGIPIHDPGFIGTDERGPGGPIGHPNPDVTIPSDGQAGSTSFQNAVDEWARTDTYYFDGFQGAALYPFYRDECERSTLTDASTGQRFCNIPRAIAVDVANSNLFLETYAATPGQNTSIRIRNALREASRIWLLAFIDPLREAGGIAQESSPVATETPAPVAETTPAEPETSTPLNPCLDEPVAFALFYSAFLAEVEAGSESQGRNKIGSAVHLIINREAGGNSSFANLPWAEGISYADLLAARAWALECVPPERYNATEREATTWYINYFVDFFTASLLPDPPPPDVPEVSEEPLEDPDPIAPDVDTEDPWLPGRTRAACVEQGGRPKWDPPTPDSGGRWIFRGCQRARTWVEYLEDLVRSESPSILWGILEDVVVRGQFPFPSGEGGTAEGVGTDPDNPCQLVMMDGEGGEWPGWGAGGGAVMVDYRCVADAERDEVYRDYCEENQDPGCESPAGSGFGWDAACWLASGGDVQQAARCRTQNPQPAPVYRPQPAEPQTYILGAAVTSVLCTYECPDAPA